MGYSSITVQGNLTADPKLEYIPSGKAILKMSVAVNNGKESVTYFDVVCWEKQAEFFAEQQLSKGQGVLVTGWFQLREWKNKDGDKRFTPTITAQNIFPLARLRKADTPTHDEEGADEEMEEVELH